MSTKSPPSTAKTEFERCVRRVNESFDKTVKAFIHAIQFPSNENVEKAYQAVSSYVDRHGHYIACWTADGTKRANRLKAEQKPKRKWEWPKEENTDRQKAIERLEKSRQEGLGAILQLLTEGGKKGISPEAKMAMAVQSYGILATFHGHLHFLTVLWNAEGKWNGWPRKKRIKKI